MQFHEAWKKLIDWLEDAENHLDSELEISNDPDKIKLQLSKHKVNSAKAGLVLGTGWKGLCWEGEQEDISSAVPTRAVEIWESSEPGPGFLKQFCFPSIFPGVPEDSGWEAACLRHHHQDRQSPQRKSLAAR